VVFCSVESRWPAGAKLFYLNGMSDGKHMNREVLHLARFISVMKFHPLNWRMNHPFLLADSLEVGLPAFRYSHITIGQKNRRSVAI